MLNSHKDSKGNSMSWNPQATFHCVGPGGGRLLYWWRACGAEVGVWVSKVRDPKRAKGSVPKGEGKRGILSEEGRSQNLGRTWGETQRRWNQEAQGWGQQGNQGETSEENLGTEQLRPPPVSTVRSSVQSTVPRGANWGKVESAL